MAANDRPQTFSEYATQQEELRLRRMELENQRALIGSNYATAALQSALDNAARLSSEVVALREALTAAEDENEELRGQQSLDDVHTRGCLLEIERLREALTALLEATASDAPRTRRQIEAARAAARLLLDGTPAKEEI